MARKILELSEETNEEDYKKQITVRFDDVLNFLEKDLPFELFSNKSIQNFSTVSNFH
jgi:hypothetical protein